MWHVGTRAQVDWKIKFIRRGENKFVQKKTVVCQDTRQLVNKINCMSQIEFKWSRAIERETSEDPTMFFLVICVLFSCIHSPLGENIEFTRSEETCNLRYTSETQASKGNRYMQPEGNLIVCCAGQITASNLTLDMNKRDRNCCVEGNRAIVGGLRPCAGRMIMTTFIPPQKEPGYLGYTVFTLDVRPYYSCPNYTKLYREAKLVDTQGYRLIPVVDGNKCKDPKKPWHIRWMGIAPGYRKFAYSWCCSQDIYSDYSLDPKALCCGLSGAQSNYYATSTQLMPDNPRCCRYFAGGKYAEGIAPFCETYLLNNPSKTAQYRTCPPPSGLYDVTPDLDELIPKAGPYSYAFPIDSVSTNDLHSVSLCNLDEKHRFRKYKYFYSPYSVGDRLYDTQNVYTIPIDDAFGICCKRKNAFALSKKKLIRSCCSTVTTNYDKSFRKDKNYCHLNGTFNRSFFFFRPCFGFHACNDGVLYLHYPNRKVNYSVIRSTDPNLYGSGSFFLPKNEKATGPVPIVTKPPRDYNTRKPR